MLHRGTSATEKEAHLNLGRADVSRDDKEMGEVAATVRPHWNLKFTPGN